MIWSKRKDPLRDSRVVAHICRDPDLHREWKVRVFVFSLFSFVLGAVVQWVTHLLP